MIWRAAGVSRSVVVDELLAGVERQRYPMTLARLALAVEQPWDYLGAAPPPNTPAGPAANLACARLAHGWTGGELAAASGVSLKTVRDLEGGQAGGSTRT